ncbi:MAG: hypothetical protein WD335_01635 [Candidatus Paceibacterota bacterium]
MYIYEKKIGETPLAALNRFRKENSIAPDIRLSYAGRLDPMASGKLLILEGEENDRRENYLRLDKTYEFYILFGVSTDTFDLLGMVDDFDTAPTLTKKDVEKTLRSFVGTSRMIYPSYSAKTVAYKGDMVPLWQLAKEGKIDEVTLPEKKVEVYKALCMDLELVNQDYIYNYINNYIKKVSGDFRQQEILERWKSVLLQQEGEFPLARCSVSGSSGLYVRRLAHEVGRELGIPSLAFSIRRTKIGDQ